MADDRIRRDADEIDLDDEQTLPDEGGIAELSEGEIDEDDDFLDDDDD
jgi:hypothetical protein